jgi:hypothetical protein
MRLRMRPFLAAGVAVCVTVVGLGIEATRADECLSRPNGPSPPGSHWFYRLDRANHRQCWYLGPEGARAYVAHETAAPVRARAAKVVAQPSRQAIAPPEAEDTATESAEEAIAGKSRAPIAQYGAMTGASTSFSALPRPVASNEARPPSVQAAVQEEVTSEADEDMPLIWPVLSPQDLAAAGASSDFPISFAQVAAALAAALGVAALLVRATLRPVTSTRRQPVPRPSREWQPRRGAAGRARVQAGAAAADVEARMQVLLQLLQGHQTEHRHPDRRLTSERIAA